MRENRGKCIQPQVRAHWKITW